MIKIKFHIIFSVIAILIFAGMSFSQQSPVNTAPADTLTLERLIKEVIENHPSVKEAEEKLNESDARVNLAKTGYYPNADIKISYTRLTPISTFDVPMLGSFKLFPENDYFSALNLSENVFDFGKTKRKAEYETENRNLSKQNLEQIKQSLSISAVTAYFTVLYLQEAIDIKNEQLRTLNSHLEFVQKKQETGSAIKYEILTTQVKITNVESQKTDLEAALVSQMSTLNTLIGKPPYTEHIINRELPGNNIGVNEDSLVSYAVENRDEMVMAREKAKLSELKYGVLELQNYPELNVFAIGGWKNGYIPDLYKMTFNLSVGFGITIPIFDAGRNKNNLLIAKSNITEENYQIESAKRKIISEVVQNNENLKASKKKLGQFMLQLEQAEKAYSLAEINFKEGAITNLDLLDAETTVSESRLMLLKAKIECTINTFKLKSTIGQRLY
ncbi:MAG: TolC family protein [Bacteroidetes bacterium]|nr:TolC family protein [Bacteroidota bacterium]